MKFDCVLQENLSDLASSLINPGFKRAFFFHFCTHIAVSHLRPVIGFNFEIEWRTQTNSRRIQMIVQIFHLKFNSIYWKFDFHSHHQALASLGNTSTNAVYTMLLVAHFLYFSAHYFRSRPLFRFSHRRLVHISYWTFCCVVSPIIIQLHFVEYK